MMYRVNYLNPTGSKIGTDPGIEKDKILDRFTHLRKGLFESRLSNIPTVTTSSEGALMTIT